MQGSLYPNGVLIDRTALRRTETSKASEILQMRTDVTSRGVFSGGVITAAAVTAGRIDIAAFSGYTPRGDYIEETGTNTEIALADVTATTVNVVCAVYTESNIHSQPHETDGSTYPTEAQGTYRIRLFTQANFDNPAVLPPTDDNLQNDALDRCLVLGKVTAEGVGNPITTIQLPTTFDNVLYTSPQQLITVTGVTILDIDPDTPTGTGTITFDDTGAPPYDFQYTSPGGVISAASSTAVDAELTITDGSGYWIKIQVIVSQLPIGLVVPFAETFQIINLYYQAVPRMTAEDDFHRQLLGTGIVTPTNPHGNSLDDFAGQTLSLLDEHQDIMHCNGIWRGSSSNIFLGSINTLTAGGDTLTIVAPGATDLFYVNGVKGQTLSPVQVIFDAATFVSGYFGAAVAKEGSKLIEFYVDDNETLVPNTRVEYPDPRNCIGSWIVDISPDHPAGTFDLNIEVDGGGTTLTCRWGDTDSYEEVVPTPTSSGVVGQVVRLYHPNNVDWIDLYLGDDSGVGDPYLPAAGTNNTDTVTVHAALSREDHMQFMSVPYYYNIVGPRGAIGYPPYGVGARVLTDNRIWGNLCIDQFADEALNQLIYYPTFEYNYSGILNRRHLGFRSDWQIANLSAPSLNIRQSGGVCYIRGKRLEVDGADSALADNQTTIIWVDYEGTLHYDDFSASPFTSSYQQAIEWLVGYPQDWDVEKVTDYLAAGEVTPQRGLPLYVVTTLAGAVTNTVDLKKLVGSHVEDWSVGADTDGAQFSSLEAAFAYAAHENRASVSGNEAITIKLVGASTITTTVTQPTYVRVEGTWDTGTTVTVNPSAPDTDGSWRLSTGCVVSNVRVVNSVAGPAFGLANNILLERIYLTAATGNFSTITQSANDVTIKDCYIETNAGFFYVPGALVATFGRLRIKDNYILSSNSQGNTLLRVDDADYCEITGNYFNKDNANSNIDPVLEVTNSTGARIEKNLVLIGPGDGTAIEQGILVDTCSGVQIKGNAVTRNGGASTYGIGIQAVDCSVSLIEENIVNIMAIGILAGSWSGGGSTGYFEECSITNNLIAGCYSRGIEAYADADGTVAGNLIGLRIEGNQILRLAKSAAADAFFGASLIGINVYAVEPGLYSIQDFVIKNNTIDTVANLQVAGDTLGIVLTIVGDIATTPLVSLVDGIAIDDNIVSRLTCTTGNTVEGIISSITIGRYPTVPLALGSVHNCSYSRNTIVLASTFSSGSGSVVEGINLTTGILGGYNALTYQQQINDNSIYILTGTPFTAVGDGIIINNTSTTGFKNSSISGNNIEVPWYGITASVQEASTISNNQIRSGAVGVHSPWLYQSEITNNSIRVESNNENSDLTIDATNYGQMGILVTTSYSESSVKNNKIELHEQISSNNLSRGSASIALSGAASHFNCDANTSIHYYTDLKAGGGGTKQAFHIYIENPDYVWSFSQNVIYNDGVLLSIFF